MYVYCISVKSWENIYWFCRKGRIRKCQTCLLITFLILFIKTFVMILFLFLIKVHPMLEYVMCIYCVICIQVGFNSYFQTVDFRNITFSIGKMKSIETKLNMSKI